MVDRIFGIDLAGRRSERSGKNKGELRQTGRPRRQAQLLGTEDRLMAASDDSRDGQKADDDKTLKDDKKKDDFGGHKDKKDDHPDDHRGDDDHHGDDDHKHPHPPKPPGPPNPPPPEPPGPPNPPPPEPPGPPNPPPPTPPGPPNPPPPQPPGPPNPPPPTPPGPPEPPTPPPDDRITEAEIRAALSGLFRRQYAFADSYSDYGSRAALLQQSLGASEVPPVQPPWSGVSFSNANFNWQIGLRRSLGINTPTVELPGLPANPFYAIPNPYIGQLPVVPKGGGSSYAIGGATTGTLNLWEVLAQDAANAAKIAGTGIQGQIQTALQVDKLQLDSRSLSVLWGGGNDLLVAEGAGASLSSTLETVLDQLREDLIALVRNGEGRQVLLGALAPLQGTVNGVAYQMPFLTALLAKAEAAPSGSYLKEWQSYINGGGIQEFQASVLAMVEEVQAMYPYANLMGLVPEYEAFSQEFGKAYGSFANYGINNTLGYAQLSGTTPEQDANSFLYFDSVHATKSGQVMLERGIELTLIREKSAIKASTLTKFQVGNNKDSVLTGTFSNDGIRGRGGNDRITGRRGWDDLRGERGADQIYGGRGNDKIAGGVGNDYMKGNLGADFFYFNRADANGRNRDTIAGFRPQQGDRLGINTVIAPTDLFEGSQWNYIGSNAFTGQAGELRFSGSTLQGDVTGDGEADLRIRLQGITTFSTDWIS